MPGQFGTSLNNPPQRYLIESYSDAAGNWYRVYSDGWIEQGGFVTGNEYYWTKTVNLLKPFKNVNYTVNATSVASSSTSYGVCCSVNSKTINSFLIMPLSTWARDSTITKAGWFACGYGAGA